MPPVASLVDRRPDPTRTLRARSAALATSALLVTVTACSLDWAVRDDPGGPGSPDGSTSDARDAAMTFADGSDAEVADAPVGTDGADCSGLASNVATAKLAARACQLVQMGQCTTTITDECGCMVVVRTAGSAESTAYTNAIATYLAACGKPTCAACPQLTPPQSWVCLQNPSAVECSP